MYVVLLGLCGLGVQDWGEVLVLPWPPCLPASRGQLCAEGRSGKEAPPCGPAGHWLPTTDPPRRARVGCFPSASLVWCEAPVRARLG